MISEDEIAAWLSRTRTPVRRDGVLLKVEVAEAITAYFSNGSRILEDALFLASNSRISRASALTVLGLEEIAKIPLLVNTFLRYEHGIDKNAWKEYWRSGGKHKKKQELILSYGQKIRGQIDGDPMHGRRLYSYYAQESVLENLDWFKQSNLYVDIRQDGIYAPGSEEGVVEALDYLLTRLRRPCRCTVHDLVVALNS
jgi:AbiV family abortive infection protein